MTAVSDHRIETLPVLVLQPHNRCNCRCVMCDIWKIRGVREITRSDLEPHVSSLRKLQVRWIVFSGGEPLMHSDLSGLCELLRAERIRLTLLTAGLSLERHASTVVQWMDDLIVSIDGPPAIHDCIRGVNGAFRQLQRGIETVRGLRPGLPIHGRCTVQKVNCSELRNTVRTAHAISLNSVSFLAADVTSAAFNRPEGWPPERQSQIGLTLLETETLETEIDALVRENAQDMESGFVVENAEKLRRIARHFRVHLGQVPPISPRCNAPWVSAVVEADGTVKPCFFHRGLGNIHDQSLLDILNGDDAVRFRSQLDVATDPTCRDCVCSLFLRNSFARR
ncbi:MAG TPA: radical SAM protein [Terriglobia bacterium]|nr:radical SAM protein [Terriglobia bacterium]